MAGLMIPRDFPPLPGGYGTGPVMPRPQPQIPMPTPYGTGVGAASPLASSSPFGTTASGMHSQAKQREDEDYKRRVAREQEAMLTAQQARAQQQALFELQKQQQEMTLHNMQYPDLVQTEYGGISRPNYEEMIMGRDQMSRQHKLAMEALRAQQAMRGGSQSETTTNRSLNRDPGAIQAILALMPGRV